LVRENGSNTGNRDITVMSSANSTKDRGNVIFCPGYELSNELLNKGFPDRETIYWLVEQFIREDKNFIDIGADIGSFTLVCGKKANRTYSVECDTKKFCYLSANIVLHGLEDKISPLNFALSDREKNNEKNSFRTLDSFNLNNACLIKIKAHGFEKKIIFGALKTLECSGWPPLVFQFSSDEKKSKNELIEYISNLGYKIQSLITSNNIILATKN
jgi:hypothetical protein